MTELAKGMYSPSDVSSSVVAAVTLNGLRPGGAKFADAPLVLASAAAMSRRWLTMAWSLGGGVAANGLQGVCTSLNWEGEHASQRQGHSASGRCALRQ